MASSTAISLHRAPAPQLPRTRGIEAFGLTDPGIVRETNEDAYAVVAKLGLYAVADGVGGNAAGEVASRMALDSVVAFFEEIAAGPLGDGDAQETAWHTHFARALIESAVEEANAMVWAAAAATPSMAGMATTFTGLLLLHNRAVIAHLGDSRAYVLRGPRLHRLTEDHTLAAAYVQAGIMTAEDAATSPLRSRLVKAVGNGERVEVDSRLVAVEPGDTFLLCSDGLHDVVDEEDITTVLLGERDLTRAASKLVDRANDEGGPDNVTAVLVRVA